jgi:hypothetical protein
MAVLPYISTPGNIEKALLAIESAATPPTVSQDFVKTILKILGGSGSQMTSYLRKIGFMNDDGTPSEIYKKFRNTATEGSAAAAALNVGELQELRFVHEPINEGDDAAGVREDFGPFAKRLIRGDDDGVFLVATRDDLEEQVRIAGVVG